MKRINITQAATVLGVAGLLGIASVAIAGDQKPAAKPAAPAYTDPASLPKFKNVVVVNATAEQRAAWNAKPAPVMAGQKAYIDAQTGRIRQVTPEDLAAEAAAAKAAPQSAPASSGPTEVAAANGGVVGMLDESSHVYSVAQIGPDGKLREICVDAQPNGEAALKSAAAKLAQEEESHEE